MRSVPLQLAPAIRAEAVVSLNRPEGAGNHRLRLHVDGWPGSRPGQFLMLSPGALTDVRRDDPLLPRPMAVFKQHESEVEILYKVEGRGTGLLAHTVPGDRLRVVGPLGRPFEPPPGGAHSIVIGGGTGVASIFGLVAEAPADSRMTVILGARAKADLMARSDFEDLRSGLREGAPEDLNIDLRLTTEDGSLGQRGLVTDALAELLAQGDVARVYCCGPTPMMRRCAEMAASSSVHCVVSLENNMACGFGVCLGCAAPCGPEGYALVCRDGPVFDADEIRWEGLP
jgi:dihydroorotate dehydrogenase electron transfer subunit